MLNHCGGAGEAYTVDFDIVPPVEGKTENRVTPEQRAANNVRMAQEDSIRNAYIASWMPKADAFALAEKLGADTTKVWNVISASRGNWAAIAQFLTDAAAAGRPELCNSRYQLPVAIHPHRTGGGGHGGRSPRAIVVAV